MQKKKKKSNISVPVTVALVICVGVLVFSLWQLSGIYLEYKKGSDDDGEILFPAYVKIMRDENKKKEITADVTKAV